MSTVKSIVEDAISHHKVVIFSKTTCPYCQKAKDLFDQLNVEYYALELDTHEHGADIQGYLHSKTGQRTVPNIFVTGHHIGGSDDLAKANITGELQKYLNY